MKRLRAYLRRRRVRHLLARYGGPESFRPVPERLVDVINGGPR